MKIRILSILISLIAITSFGASALNIEAMKKDNFKGWWYDKETKQNYYFKDGEIIKNKWFESNGNWYYFDNNGYMQTGWINLNNNWYYLNKSGSMQTGWLEGKDGKWYYLNSDGTMMHDATTPDGYKIGPDGVWIK